MGAGAAGLELASYLSQFPLSITLIESGFETFNWHVQRLSRCKQIGMAIRSGNYNRPFGLEDARKTESHLRQFGGTLNIWGRRWKMLDPIDLQPKPELQLSGWPITYEELYGYYCKIAEKFDVRELCGSQESLSKKSGLALDVRLDGKEGIDVLMKSLQPSNGQSDVRVILGANATDLRLSNHQVSGIVVKSLEGHTQCVEAKFVVLACGTIENARLLLTSNIGNENGWVGKNMIDHLKGRVFLSVSDPSLFPPPYREVNGKVLGHGLIIQPDLLQEWKLPNHSLWLQRFLDTPKGIHCKCRFVLEQLPNPHSRVLLAEERDELGMPLACLDWRLREEDMTRFRHFVEKMDQLLSHLHGHFASVYDITLFRDCSHQMGTTRMAAKPEDGVVDPNCKVFGMDNLYIAGNSVFPSGGNANPTFTLLALTRRLGEHLGQKLRG